MLFSRLWMMCCRLSCAPDIPRWQTSAPRWRHPEAGLAITDRGKFLQEGPSLPSVPSEGETPGSELSLFLPQRDQPRESSHQKQNALHPVLSLSLGTWESTFPWLSPGLWPFVMVTELKHTVHSPFTFKPRTFPCLKFHNPVEKLLISLQDYLYLVEIRNTNIRGHSKTYFQNKPFGESPIGSSFYHLLFKLTCIISFHFPHF